MNASSLIAIFDRMPFLGWTFIGRKKGLATLPAWRSGALETTESHEPLGQQVLRHTFANQERSSSGGFGRTKPSPWMNGKTSEGTLT